MKLTFKEAIKEMRKGKFITTTNKKAIKGIYYFTNNKTRIGDNPNERIYIINIGNSKVIDLNKINLKWVESGFYFLSSFDDTYISKNLKIIKEVVEE